MHDPLTDVLDLLGALALVAAAAVWAGTHLGLAAALLVVGLGLLAVSWSTDHAARLAARWDRRRRIRRARRSRRGDQ